jgi:hypothetical protein
LIHPNPQESIHKAKSTPKQKSVIGNHGKSEFKTGNIFDDGFLLTVPEKVRNDVPEHSSHITSTS